MTRTLLFMSSLSPGVLVASVRALGQNQSLGVIGIIVGVILMPLGFITIKIRDKAKPIPTELRSMKDQTYQVPTYLVTFVLPFLFIDAKNIATLVAYAIFILFVALILSKSDISLLNPGLLLLNYRLFDATDKCGRNLTVISRVAPRMSGYESLRHLSGRVYLLEQKGSDD